MIHRLLCLAAETNHVGCIFPEKVPCMNKTQATTGLYSSVSKRGLSSLRSHSGYWLQFGGGGAGGGWCHVAGLRCALFCSLHFKKRKSLRKGNNLYTHFVLYLLSLLSSFTYLMDLPIPFFYFNGKHVALKNKTGMVQLARKKDRISH